MQFVCYSSASSASATLNVLAERGTDIVVTTTTPFSVVYPRGSTVW
jgi:hypothetical protein